MPTDKKLYEPVEFIKYDKISDDIIGLGRNAVLRFNIGLSKSNQDSRFFYHKEFEYAGKFGPTVVIKRTFDYYMTIENYAKPTIGDKAYIRIGLAEFLLFKNAIDACVSWFMDKKFAKLFVKINNKLSLSSPIPNYKIERLPMNKWLRFEPIIIEGLDYQEPGVRITLSDEVNYSDIGVDKIMGLQSLLSTMNMFAIAESMLSSIPAPIGTNRIKLDDGTSASYHQSQQKQTFIDSYKTSSIEGRKIGQAKRIEDLEG